MNSSNHPFPPNILKNKAVSHTNQSNFTGGKVKEIKIFYIHASRYPPQMFLYI